MIQGTYYKEWSRMLGRDMEFKVLRPCRYAGAGSARAGRPLLRLGKQRDARCHCPAAERG